MLPTAVLSPTAVFSPAQYKIFNQSIFFMGYKSQLLCYYLHSLFCAVVFAYRYILVTCGHRI